MAQSPRGGCNEHREGCRREVAISRNRRRTGARGAGRVGEPTCRARFFRAQTLAIVRNFFEIACQIGRLPSILGRSCAPRCHRAIPSFEEQAASFVHDVEWALGRLNEQNAEVIAMVGLFQYSLDDVARLLGRSRSLVARRFAGADSPPEEMDLPPKKPAASVDAERYRELGEEGGKYSFMARAGKA